MGSTAAETRTKAPSVDVHDAAFTRPATACRGFLYQGPHVRSSAQATQATKSCAREHSFAQLPTRNSHLISPNAAACCETARVQQINRQRNHRLPHLPPGFCCTEPINCGRCCERMVTPRGYGEHCAEGKGSDLAAYCIRAFALVYKDIGVATVVPIAKMK